MQSLIRHIACLLTMGTSFPVVAQTAAPLAAQIVPFRAIPTALPLSTVKPPERIAEAVGSVWLQFSNSDISAVARSMPFNLYRDYASSMMMISLASLMRSGISLRSSLERTYKNSSPWGKWHIRQVLINLSKPNRGTFSQAFTTGLFDQDMEDRVQDASERSNPIEAFIHIGVGSIDRMILRIEKRAQQLNTILMVVCGLILGTMMLAFMQTTMSLQSGIRNNAPGIVQ